MKTVSPGLLEMTAVGCSNCANFYSHVQSYLPLIWMETKTLALNVSAVISRPAGSSFSPSFHTLTPNSSTCKQDRKDNKKLEYRSYVGF